MTPIKISTLNYLQRVARELDHLVWKFENDAEDAKAADDHEGYVSDGRRADHVKEVLERLITMYDSGNGNLTPE